MTGTTVVTREPEWDAEARGRALRLSEYEATICRCGCGQPIKLAHDPKQPFLVDHFTCQAGRAIEKVRRTHREEADRANRPDGWDDGRHYYVTPVDQPATPDRKGTARG